MPVLTTKQILGVDKHEFRHPPVDMVGVLRSVLNAMPGEVFVDRYGKPQKGVVEMALEAEMEKEARKPSDGPPKTEAKVEKKVPEENWGPLV